MAIINFTDGVRFDTSGALRLERRGDGLYVVGKGLLVPVDTWEEGQKLIADWHRGEHIG